MASRKMRSLGRTMMESCVLLRSTKSQGLLVASYHLFLYQNKSIIYQQTRVQNKPILYQQARVQNKPIFYQQAHAQNEPIIYHHTYATGQSTMTKTSIGCTTP